DLRHAGKFRACGLNAFDGRRIVKRCERRKVFDSSNDLVRENGGLRVFAAAMHNAMPDHRNLIRTRKYCRSSVPECFEHSVERAAPRLERNALFQISAAVIA